MRRITLILTMFLVLVATAIGCSSTEGMKATNSVQNIADSTTTGVKDEYTLDAKIMKVVGVYQLRISSDIKYSEKNENGEMVNGDGYFTLYVNDKQQDPVVNNSFVQLTGLEEGNNTVRVVFTTNDHQETNLVKELTVEIPKSKDILLDEETLRNISGKVMIKSVTLNKAGVAGHSSLGIVSKSGTTIVSDPNFMPVDKGLIKADIITTSHSHGDHVDNLYTQRNAEAGWTKFSVMKEENFTVKDVTVTGVGGGHNSNYDPLWPDNFIYIFEVDGIRIANLADMGQDELTEDQLQKIGKVDIAFLPMTDSTQVGFGVEKSVKIIQQLQPKIVSPIHYSKRGIDLILKETNIKDRSEVDVLTLDAEDIAALTETKYIFLK